MINSSSSSKLPISQEIKTPNLFNFSIPSPEKYLSTPFCGVGETDESNTPHTEVAVSPVLKSGEVLSCSPTLVLFGDKYENFEARSVVKPSLGTPSKELEVMSRVVSSTMSERLFERDLPKGKGPESNILAAVEKLEEEEEETFLVWRRKRVRGANTLTIVVPDLEAVDVVHETKLDNEPTRSERERKIKGKGEMVESYTKGDKKKYATRGAVQKIMGSVIAANQIQIEKIRKIRRDGHVPKEPTSTPLHIGSSETDSDDIIRLVFKRKKEAEIEWVRAKGGHKSVKKAPVKKESVIKQATVKLKPVNGPSPFVQKPVEQEVLTREECIVEMEKQKVLNGRVFDPKIHTEFGMSTPFDFGSLQGWDHLFEAPSPYLHKTEVREFYYKMKLLSDGEIKTTMRGVDISLNDEILGINLSVPDPVY
ncbi:hypothetical protein H5410_050450 [Solanum commersonii]|uniref:Uncharacterized protein n=1 Tax=Solanum commersonii TaxID=4109 RepID=A0A9J5WWT8_SOLCO|nr:hypothetical protein H5410_050450 [Solanum commersonii]